MGFFEKNLAFLERLSKESGRDSTGVRLSDSAGKESPHPPELENHPDSPSTVTSFSSSGAGSPKAQNRKEKTKP